MADIVIYLVVNSQKLLKFEDRFKVFYNVTDAITHAKSIGYIGELPEKLEAGIGYVYMEGEDINVMILPVKIQ